MPDPYRVKLQDVWAILVDECGARDDAFMEFICNWPKCVEFRFGGKLGFGGKVWADRDRIHVTCYPEDMTDERRAIIERTNDRLSKLV